MKLQKIASLVLALVMIFSLGITAFAADEKGSITVNNVVLNNEDKPIATYTIYKLLDLESYDVAKEAFSYKVNSAWAGFFEGIGASYVAIDSDGYVTWKAEESEEKYAEFAKVALKYAEENDVEATADSKTSSDFAVTTDKEGKVSGKFSNLELGYYLVDTNVGALCGLTTTNPDASVNAKNGHPLLGKTVQEDSTNQWVDKNTADIGQIVNFAVTIDVAAGAQNYILHDEMSEGLTFKTVTEVRHIEPATGNTEGNVVSADKYETKTENLGDNCTFEVHFDNTFCEGLEVNDKIVVYYQAMLNREAVINGEGNPNEAWLAYGEKSAFTTAKAKTITYTYGIDVVKTDGANILIDGAEFRIYDAAEGGNEVGVVLMDDGVTYRRARQDEVEKGENVPIVVTNGQVRVVGFDNGTYYLEETVAPDGYNKLSARQKFIINNGNLDAIFNDGVFSTGSGVHVVNKTGSMLPETGGMGTTIFYVAGGLLVGGAIVALVSKKRMSNK